MNTKNKKYYWIKLKTDFFAKDEIDYLLSQKNGCEYIVLYQMLCLITANNDGKLASKIGEIMIRFDIDKIVRETKYFKIDTVAIALDLYRKLGLIYEGDNNILKISYHNDMVGSEVSSAKRVREYRERQNKIALQCNNDVTQEIEIDIESRDKEIEIESVSVSDAENKKLNEILERHQIESERIKEQLKEYINNKMKIDIINNALMIPYDRNVMNIFDGTYPDPEEYVPPIKDPLAYSMAILEKWNEFGVRDIEDVKKYNKLLKSKNY